MVLQQGVPVPVWGEARPGTLVTVTFSEKKYQAEPGISGKWKIILDSHEFGGPHAMEISAPDTKIIYNDIYFGDVWICSGQSNMELPMARLKDNYPEEWDLPVNSLIRQFKVPQEWDFSVPRKFYSGGSWAAASGETLKDFSGTAWFFAKEMHKKTNIPIGIINAAWGGTPVEAWMSREALAAFPYKIALADKYSDSCLCDSIIADNEKKVHAWHEKLVSGDSGLSEAWYKPEASGWDTARSLFLPGDFSDAGINNFYGVIWFRRDFDIDDNFLVSGREIKLWLGTIVDSDTVYINGVEVGSIDYRYPPRKYSIPESLLHSGKNQIVARVICCNGGGGFTREKDFRIFSGNENIDLGGDWSYRVGIAMENPRPELFFFRSQPIGLFNAMLSPLLEYPCKGVVWYQGESNDKKPLDYSALFTAFINDWRSRTRNDLPFLFVQLPVFGEPEDNNETGSWAIIRQAQADALSLPVTGLAVALEFGEWNDLHPVNKKDIGRRLALAADKVVYHETNTSPGPLFRCMRRQGNKILLTFDNCGKGLAAREKPYVSVLSCGKLFRLPAEIAGPETVSIDVTDLQNPEKILYAWANNPRDRQLYNTDGLPVIPFSVAIN